jgi:hypothetical protein
MVARDSRCPLSPLGERLKSGSLSPLGERAGGEGYLFISQLKALTPCSSA